MRNNEPSSSKKRNIFFVSTTARRYPLSYIFSGVYEFNTAKLVVQGTDAIYWSSTNSASEASSYLLAMGGAYLNPESNYPKLWAGSLRLLKGCIF